MTQLAEYDLEDLAERVWEAARAVIEPRCDERSGPREAEGHANEIRNEFVRLMKTELD